ncbi:MAG: hypothetical protein Q9209_004495 [Squamulea sp. 1 TL-2023]
MKSLIITTIVGTITFAINGVTGAALPADVTDRAVDHCGALGVCSWGDYGAICCAFPPGKDPRYPRDEKLSITERGNMETTSSSSMKEVGNTGSDDNVEYEEAHGGQDLNLAWFDVLDDLKKRNVLKASEAESYVKGLETRKAKPDKTAHARDIPAAVKYTSLTSPSSTPASDAILDYLKCKDFCKFDTNSPPTCLPNCYVIDGQVQVDAPGILIPPSSDAFTTPSSSIIPSPTTLQTSTTSSTPISTDVSPHAVDKRVPPNLVTANNSPKTYTCPPKHHFGPTSKKSNYVKPGCNPRVRRDCYLPMYGCVKDAHRKRQTLGGDFQLSTEIKATTALEDREIEAEWHPETKLRRASSFFDIGSWEAKAEPGLEAREGHENPIPGPQVGALKKEHGNGNRQQSAAVNPQALKNLKDKANKANGPHHKVRAVEATLEVFEHDALLGP